MAFGKQLTPDGFAISHSRSTRWRWRQSCQADSPDVVTERSGFPSRRAAHADLRAELARRRERAVQKLKAARA